MKTERLSLSRPICWSALLVCALLFSGTSVQAQQATGPLGLSVDGFYRGGDAFSEKVSGFFRNIFGGSDRGGRPQAPQPAQQNVPTYQQPQTTTSRSSQSKAKTTKSTPPVYHEAPATSSRSTASKTTKSKSYAATKPQSSRSSGTSSDSPSKRSAANDSSSTSSGGYYTSTKRKTDSSDTPTPPVTRKGTETTETVVQAPKSSQSSKISGTSIPSPGISPYSIDDSTPNNILPTPSSSTKSETTAKVTTPPSTPAPSKPATTTPPSTSTSTASSSQEEFPTGSPGKKPGRVVSPYAPHNELDVRGLPSGSLALDPTTQKVFKVP